ncbi:hypothetical protein [Cryobacterium roopkundense]|nr:hypothetical protein [Cryobacterium roopkundense]MBB5641011.1 hypothetical protein [Cryobacterium roopkundense]
MNETNTRTALSQADLPDGVSIHSAGRARADRETDAAMVTHGMPWRARNYLLSLIRNNLAARAAPITYVNLAIGLSLLITNLRPEGVQVAVHSRNAMPRVGPDPWEHEADPKLIKGPGRSEKLLHGATTEVTLLVPTPRNTITTQISIAVAA